MPFVFVPVAASFPQIAGLRSQGSIIEDLLDYTGGADRAEPKNRARRALAETIREFNLIAWRFNRKTTDLTFAASTNDYPLPALFRNAWKVMILDLNNELTRDVEFIPYEDFLRYDGSTISKVTVPNEYTLLNPFNDGQLTFLPAIGAGPFTQSPKARVFYHERIAIPETDDDIITAPQEVTTAIVRQAAALLVARTRSFEEATRARADGNSALVAAKREWQDFPDFMGKMA